MRKRLKACRRRCPDTCPCLPSVLVCVSLSISRCLYLSFYLFAVSVCLSVCLSVCMSLSLPISVCLPACLSPPVCACLPLSLSLPVEGTQSISLQGAPPSDGRLHPHFSSAAAPVTPMAGHTSLVKLLRSHGAKTHLPPGRAARLLCSAISRGSHSELSLLVNAGLDLSDRYHGAGTPLHVAAACGDLAATRLLLDKGKDWMIPLRRLPPVSQSSSS